MSLAAKSLLSKITGSALDLLFPMSCAECGKEGDLLCPTCLPNLPRLTSPFCQRCGAPGHQSPCRWCEERPLNIDGIRGPFLFEGSIRNAVHSFKYRGVRAAAAQLGDLLSIYQQDHPVPGDVILPVPLHSRQLRKRGYNQSALLARRLAKSNHLPFDDSLLMRIKDTRPQVATTSRRQRIDNLSDSYKCRASAPGWAIILVDDVATTGSTLSACAAALKDSGASSAWGLILARET